MVADLHERSGTVQLGVCPWRTWRRTVAGCRSGAGVYDRRQQEERTMLSRLMALTLAVAFAAVLVAAPVMACDGPKADSQSESSGK